MRYSPAPAAVMVAAVLFYLPAFANPSGPAVASGTASFAANGSTLTVTASPSAIVNWQTFSIGPGETTQFVQQSAASAVLNRVTSQNPSTILGALQSNGRVFIVNPSGILFAQGSRVDTAGLVASSLAMSDADFLAGRLRFAANGAAGPVLSNGTIATTGINAPVYLIGASVTNSGVITSPGGEVVLAAGNTVEIADPGTPNITVQITAPANEAINLGSIVAPGGRLDIFGGLVRQLGAVQADTLTVGPDGAVVLGTTQPGTQAPSEAVAPALVNGSIVTPVATSGETVSTPVVPTLGTADAGSTSTTTTVPTLITGVPTLMTGVPTLITGVPTLTGSAPTSGTTTFTSTVPTLSTGVPTLTSSAPTLTSGTPTAPLSTIATPTSATVAPAPFEATIPLQ